MFDEVIQLLIERLRRGGLYRKLLIVTLIFVAVIIVWAQFLSKGSLNVVLNGYNSSSSSIEITKLSADRSAQDKEKTIEKKSREATFKLSPGRYRIRGIVRSITGVQEAATTKYIEISARKSTNINLDMFNNRIAYIKDTIDKVASIQVEDDTIYVTTVYGVTTKYPVEGGDAKVIRKEPVYLNKVVGLCIFENGNALAVNSNSELFAIVGNQGREIDIASFAPVDKLEYLEGIMYGNVNSTKKFQCDSRRALLNNIVEVDSNFSVSFNSPTDNNDVKYSNYVQTDDGRVFSFDRVDSNSFDLESANSVNMFSKSVNYNNGQDSYEVKLDSYVSDLAPLSGTQFCYSYRYSISCGDVKSGQTKEIFKSEENMEISNIEAIDDKRIIYSYGNYVMLYNIKTDESSEIYNSEYTVIPYSLVYDKSSSSVIFANQRVDGESSSYNMLVIKLNQD